MKRIISSIALLLAVSIPSYACEMCGCSANSQYLGILPQFYKEFVGFQYQYTSFTAAQPSLIDRSDYERAHEFNNTLQLWGRYYVSKRVQLFAFVPYHINTGADADTRIDTKGIGDISILANAVIIKDDKGNKPWQQTLLAGGGIKLPTGKYTGVTTLDAEGLPNVQAGTGSYDFIANTNYTIRHKRTGINVDAAYTMTTANSNHYKYGNHFNSGLVGFYWLQKGKFTLLPQIGARYEYTLHDYDNYERKWLNEVSGGSLVFGTIGIQSYYKQYGVRINYSVPLEQNYGGGYVTTNSRLETSIFFLF